MAIQKYFLLSLLSISSTASAGDITEYLIKSSTDTIARSGYLMPLEVAIGNGIISGNSAIARSCIIGTTETNDKKAERYILETKVNGSIAEIRLIAMGQLKTQTVHDAHTVDTFGSVGTDEFSYACGDSYIQSATLGGQMVLSAWLTLNNSSTGSTVSSRIEANSSDEAKTKLAPVLAQILASYHITGTSVSFDDPRSPSSTILNIFDSTISVDHMSSYLHGLLQTPQDQPLNLAPLSVMVQKY